MAGSVGEARVAVGVGVVEELEAGRKNRATWEQGNSRTNSVLLTS